MRPSTQPRSTSIAALAAIILVAAVAPAAFADSAAIARGAYLANAADCAACHTDSAHGGRPYAGGRALATPFGTFYSPNITPDADTGIGRWSAAQFLRALHDGVRADGANLFPVFPYPSFTRITNGDALAIWAYLRSLAPVHHKNRLPDLPFPLSWRPLQTVWKWLFFAPGRFHPAPGRSAEWNRGAYLVTALAHCGECHTPRNFFGAMKSRRFLAGTRHGPDGKPVPNITPDRKTGIGNWSIADIVALLTDGQTPSFDFVGGAMAEVVQSTSRLAPADRRAIALYLKSLPPLPGPERE
ncbi:MAG TPA: cytochrome c [Stellaceae bacterium]|nr:cytochrome c [Stellaceae bacterium]